MQEFDFNLRTRVICGQGALSQLGEASSSFGVRRALIVTDPGIIAAGHVERAIQSLTAAGIEAHCFDGAHENPSTEDIDRGLEFAKRCEPELLIGLGGGSSMDCAKGINFVYTNGGTMHDYHGVGKATRPMLPMIAVPTTAGTGSEMQSFALISDSKTHVKMACGDKKASCRIAILDPELTLTQPELVTALAGIDAVSHAVETFVTKRRNPVSIMYSREAWRLLAGNFKTVLKDPGNLEVRAAMQLGAAYAGVAIENSMLGAGHALANPLTASYGTAHGQAVGLMLPHVVRYNGIHFNAWYQELLGTSESLPGLPPPSSGAEGLAGFLTELIEAAGLSVKLDQCGVEAAQMPELAAAAAVQWTGTFNPRDVNQESLLGIYQSAF
ncbi:MAG: iron-containing alcohol dehydrogenase [Mariniblastus sp.]|nr:iron-containing alcohol dehydrogenase [Mariniblastus sp.]